MVDDDEKNEKSKIFFSSSCASSLHQIAKAVSGGRGTREHGEKERRRETDRQRESFVASGGF